MASMPACPRRIRQYAPNRQLPRDDASFNQPISMLRNGLRLSKLNYRCGQDELAQTLLIRAGCQNRGVVGYLDYLTVVVDLPQWERFPFSDGVELVTQLYPCEGNA